MKAVVFLLAMLAVSSVATEDEDFKKEFDRIHSTQFGHYLLNSMFLQMKSGQTSLDQYFEIVNRDLETQYHNDQKGDDEVNRVYQSACDSDIGAYDKDIHESEATLLSLHGKLEGQLYPMREIQSQVISQKSKELARIHKNIIAEYKAELDEATAERNAEHEEYEEKVKEHQEAARIIQEARSLFTENLEGGSFLEKKKGAVSFATVSKAGIAKLKDHFAYHTALIQKHHKYNKSYASLMQVLSTIASRVEMTADQGSVKRIIELCDNLLTKIGNSVDLERATDDQRAKAFAQLANMIQRNINNINQVLATHTAELAAVNDRIHQAESSQIYVTGRLGDITDQRQHRHIECEEAAFDYQTERNQRDGNRKLVSDIIGLVNRNLRGLKDMLALRVAAGDDIH